MKWPWQKELESHKVQDVRDKEEIERRLTMLEAQTKVLRARAALQRRNGSRRETV